MTIIANSGGFCCGWTWSSVSYFFLFPFSFSLCCHNCLMSEDKDYICSGCRTIKCEVECVLQSIIILIPYIVFETFRLCAFSPETQSRVQFVMLCCGCPSQRRGEAIIISWRLPQRLRLSVACYPPYLLIAQNLENFIFYQLYSSEEIDSILLKDSRKRNKNALKQKQLQYQFYQQ